MKHTLVIVSIVAIACTAYAAKPEASLTDATARLAAEKEARVAAVDAAFEDVDIWELEKAWLEFVEELPDPKGRR